MQISKEDFLALLKSKQYTNKGEFTSSAWSTGGSHGNCWDDSMYTSDADKPQQLTILDSFINEYFPDIKFMQYKNIENKIEHRTYTQSEYYGGYTNYAYLTISAEVVYESLVQAGLITNA